LTLCVGGGDSTNLNWEMPSAIFFVTTIVTTIGYGTFAPGTDAGKTFTVIFAFIGIGKCPLLGVGVPSDFFFLIEVASNLVGCSFLAMSLLLRPLHCTAYFGMVAGLVGTQVVKAIQFIAKCCCHRKQKNYKLNGKKTLYWTILILCVYIFIIGIGCYGIGWGMGDGMYCKFWWCFFCAARSTPICFRFVLCCLTGKILF
jgi:hypothetical protein